MSNGFDSDRTFLPMTAAAERLGVPAAWLRREVLAGRLPGLWAGRRLLVDVELIRKLLTERSRESGEAPDA